MCRNATEFEASWGDNDMTKKLKDGWIENNEGVGGEEKNPFQNLFLYSINYVYDF